MDLQSYGAMPGISGLVQTTENVIWSGRFDEQWFVALPIYSGAQDAGNSPVTTLRPGLVCGARTADGNMAQYVAGNTDGTGVAVATFVTGMNMLDFTGTAEQKYGVFHVKGISKPSGLYGLDGLARRQMINSGRFTFDDDYTGKNAFMGGWLVEIAKTAAYTCVAGDAGTLFTTAGATGAVQFTLPALAAAAGVELQFVNIVNQNMEITCPDGAYIVWDGALVTNITFSTSSHKIGANVVLRCNAASTNWYVDNRSPAAVVGTGS